MICLKCLSACYLYFSLFWSWRPESELNFAVWLTALTHGLCFHSFLLLKRKSEDSGQGISKPFLPNERRNFWAMCNGIKMELWWVSYKKLPDPYLVKVLWTKGYPLKSAELLWIGISTAGSVVRGPKSNKGSGKTSSPPCLSWALGIHMQDSSGVFCMCYTEADCCVAALLRSHSGQADGNFVRQGADVSSKFAVSMYFFLQGFRTLWFLGEEGLDFIFGDKIRAVL